ncbi:NUDIX hydrolase [Haloferula sargassicola]|uniref:Nudix hydrolase domain-containing protein n=1 Tax=Haloferula sargassicola TaxID=490096 RepID=A0ABP9UJH4_9BACT
MHRQPLIDALLAYREAHPDEKDTVDRFHAFVRGQSDCFERSLAIGHITGSAWVVDRSGGNVLLTHHAKLDRWLQLGGHADGVADPLAVAFTEAREESGLDDFEAVSRDIFDLDIHPIPARRDEPEHLHYDVRYVLRATGPTDYTVSDESHDLAWIPLEKVPNYTTDPSMLRMLRKWQERQ